MIIESVDQALALKEGRLAMNMGVWIECSFSTENVAEAAKLIIENNDKTEFYSQAGVVAHAGNNYGWGLGKSGGEGEKIYRTL
jgi:hypothetical protein